MRLSYETPNISTIELRPAETVLGNCKVKQLFEGPGFGGGDCVGFPPGQQCLSFGS